MRQLSVPLLAQLFSHSSDDPFLCLLTLSHPDFDDIRLVNNTENITSNSLEFSAYPFRITLPPDDGETNRDISIDFDNVGLDLIPLFRSVTDAIDVKIEYVLASLPDDVQLSFEELKIQNMSYTQSSISAKLFLDSFLNTGLSSETYSPTLYPGLF